MQDFSQTTCDNLPLGKAEIWTDARNNNVYRVKKMLDQKCWMIDNLAYGGGYDASAGGTDAYGDTHNLTFATACGNNWSSATVTNCTGPSAWTGTTGTITRYFTTNNYTGSTLTPPADLPDRMGNTVPNTTASFQETTPVPCTNSPTFSGNPLMTSECLSYLYNWCSAIGLDSTTNPTCVEVRADSTVDDSNGSASGGNVNTGMAGVGIVGKPGGIGGESKGNTQAANQQGIATSNGSICPAGWRLPVGQVDRSPNAYNTRNEFAILNNAMSTVGQDLNPNTSGGYPNWLPDGSFYSISSGYFPSLLIGLYSPSNEGHYWSSSLDAASLASNLRVAYLQHFPGTISSNKAYGLAVRCVL